MAYPAVISLKKTINGLLNSDRISLISSTRELLESAYNHTTTLQQLLTDSTGRSCERLAAYGEIRDCSHALEDALEFHELYSQHGEDEEVMKAIASFADMVKKVEVEYIDELSKLVDPQHNDDDSTVSSNVDFDVEMVGNSRERLEILKSLSCRLRPHELWFIMIYGEVCSGRTLLVDGLYEEKGKEFDCCAWVTVGTEHRLKDVLMLIIAQVDGNQDDHAVEEEEELFNYLCKVLEDRRYMIVLDDVQDVELVKYLRKSLPNRTDGSLVFFTSNLSELIGSVDLCVTYNYRAQFIQETFWMALRLIMFWDGSVPPEMEKAGKKIIENCRGLNLLFAKAVVFLYEKERTIEVWSKLAADEKNAVFMV